ncbi:hypothetical protein HBI38_085880 [Parastagonospora nodorum]|nr:hypothetical protein HBH52_092260 [Parastagonospora nodorum]KAH5069990.1 hypothetical protein HBI73_192120 [Parastagonospora nodorum]KAH5095368.1 hypothetical protein HBH72_151950 [Parastagonospora nodorum]KAH5513078.1 hypothetical protein HBI29_099590 [Parastagonospora nodorum]KAH5712856.1 hypothetical protein HBI20_162050 [Parastagonospora nodorum]
MPSALFANRIRLQGQSLEKLGGQESDKRWERSFVLSNGTRDSGCPIVRDAGDSGFLSAF